MADPYRRVGGPGRRPHGRLVGGAGRASFATCREEWTDRDALRTRLTELFAGGTASDRPGRRTAVLRAAPGRPGTRRPADRRPGRRGTGTRRPDGDRPQRHYHPRPLVPVPRGRPAGPTWSPGRDRAVLAVGARRGHRRDRGGSDRAAPPFRGGLAARGRGLLLHAPPAGHRRPGPSRTCNADLPAPGRHRRRHGHAGLRRKGRPRGPVLPGRVSPTGGGCRYQLGGGNRPPQRRLARRPGQSTRTLGCCGRCRRV